MLKMVLQQHLLVKNLTLKLEEKLVRRKLKLGQKNTIYLSQKLAPKMTIMLKKYFQSQQSIYIKGYMMVDWNGFEYFNSKADTYKFHDIVFDHLGFIYRSAAILREPHQTMNRLYYEHKPSNTFKCKITMLYIIKFDLVFKFDTEFMRRNQIGACSSSTTIGSCIAN